MLRYRLNATYDIYSSVAVQGVNAYGAGFGTMGRVRPGAVSTVTIAGEYSLTRRLVLAGPWMSVSGRNTSECFGIVAALYCFL